MNPIYKSYTKDLILPLLFVLASFGRSTAQTCSTTQGDQTTYGANNVWIGYVYEGSNFNYYHGYVNEGSTSSPNFDESFGGAQVNYATNGCSVYTDTFSVRYKLTQALSGNYTITVGGDDGYRLSLDGGATWAVNMWQAQSYGTTAYTVSLSGTYNIVLEYYEAYGDNRISFNLVRNCTGTGDPTVYGTGNIWNGYIYQGMNFNQYKGWVNEGIASNPGFDESFGNPGGSNSNTYTTNSCSITTYQFSARYRLTQTLPEATYVFTLGGDDGYRLSLDGGSTWVVNKWNDQSYTVSSYSAVLSGTYNMVYEYYDDGGADRVSFAQAYSTLPVTLTSWTVSALDNSEAKLKWTTTDAVNFDHFVVQRSTNGSVFEDVATVAGNTEDSTATQSYTYTDQDDYEGTLYYRLMMVDRDGKSSYSNIVSISLQAAKSIRIYPTVVESGTLFVETSAAVSQAKLELFDMNGHRLQENEWSSLEGRQQVTVGNGGKLPAGAYIARLSNSQTTLAKQIIVIK